MRGWFQHHESNEPSGYEDVGWILVFIWIVLVLGLALFFGIRWVT